MDGASGVVSPVVINQDDQSQLHVQAVIQSGRRQLDIRMWRRGPTGFAPSRSALTLEAADLDTLLEGITELLHVSDGAKQPARVVRDKGDERRLRAEIEPFGTRFTSRLAFWQRVRDSWRPMGDGLQLDAAQLGRLREILETLRPQLHELPDHPPPSADDLDLQPDPIHRWPAPGADWLTLTVEQIAFHPRGVRVTAMPDEEDPQCLILQQWQREDTLWVRDESGMALTLRDLDTILTHLRGLRDRKRDEPGPPVQIPGTNGSVFQLEVRLGDPAILLLGERRPDEDGFSPRISMPAQYLPRFGRTLAQAGALLLARLPKEEREALLSREDADLAPEITEAAPVLPESSEPEEDLAPNTVEAGTPEPDFPEDVVLPAIERPVSVAPEYPPEPVRRLAPLGEVRLGRHSVFLYDLREGERRFLDLQWDGRSIAVPVDEVDVLLSDLRDLYYDALRGRRGQELTIGGDPPIRISIHHQGSSTHVVFEHDQEDSLSRLHFPVGDVPSFLNVAGAAMTRQKAMSSEA